MSEILLEFWKSSGLSQLFQCDTVLFGLHMPGELIMIAIACLFLYLAIHKGYEPLSSHSHSVWHASGESAQDRPDGCRGRG